MISADADIHMLGETDAVDDSEVHLCSQIAVGTAIDRDTYRVEPLCSGHVYDDEELSSVELPYLVEKG